jgi:catecholate siderophore receptor
LVAQTNDPQNPTLTILNGDQRVEGLELGISGYVAKHLEVVAGYTYLVGKTLSSGTPAYGGQALPNVARNALNLWTEYEITDAWEVRRRPHGKTDHPHDVLTIIFALNRS